MKKITRQRALNIAWQLFEKEVHSFIEFINGEISEQYFEGISQLCHSLGELNPDWQEYWDKINIEHNTLMTDYFNHFSDQEEDTILRLLVLHQFINETYED